MEKVYADYNKCLINVSSSILKHFGIEWKYNGIDLLDKELMNKKKVVLMLLDGMGVQVMKDNLQEDSFLNKHKVDNISSVFPPTTVAATTSLLSGLAPIEHGYLGWHLYLKDHTPSIVLFKGFDYYRNKKYKRINVKEILNYKSIMDRINETGVKAYSVYPKFMQSHDNVFGCETFQSALNKLKYILDYNDESFTYFYWDNPDGLLHDNGVNNDVIKGCLSSFDDALNDFSKELDEDTIMIIVADHGLIDIKGVDFSRFKDLSRMLKKKFSAESRAPMFHVKKKYLNIFKDKFNYYFCDYYDIYSKEETFDLGLYGCGDPHPSTKFSFGDFVAVSKKEYSLSYGLDSVMKGHHAGGTKAELEIPLIIVKGERIKNEEN